MCRMIKIGIGSVRGDSELSSTIVVSTAPKVWLVMPKKLAEVPSHTLVWFEREGGARVYFEALINEGWTGPHELEKLDSWVKESPKRWAKLYDLSEFFSEDEIQSCYEYAVRMKSRWTYATKALPLMLRCMAGIRRIVKSTPFLVICSEGASRVCCNSFFSFTEWTGSAYHDYQNPFEIDQAAAEIRGKPDLLLRAE